jgi:hypothetical protein
MSKIMSKSLRVAFAAAALCAGASTADARPRSVVVLDFDGPRKLADSGHEAVLKYVGGKYDVVNTKRWDDAKSDASRANHGPAAWRKAARAAGVDAVIEGWVQDEGRKHVMTLVVREASTGNEIDQVTVKLADTGMTPESTKALTTSLDEVLEYVITDGSDAASKANKLPAASIPRKMIGARAGESDDRVKAVDDADRPRRSSDDDSSVDRPRKSRSDDDSSVDRPRKSRSDDDSSVDRSRKSRSDDDSSSVTPPRIRETRITDASTIDDRGPKKSEIVVAATSPDDKESRNDLVDLFPTPSRERDIIEPKKAHKPVQTPKFQISGGGYLVSRQLEFTASEQTGPMEYVGTQVQGLQVQAAVYPWPLQKMDGKLSGVGFSVKFAKSVGSFYTFDDGETTADYTIDQSMFEGKIHYRYPMSDSFTLDSHVGYGRAQHIIQDAPEELEVPDVSYEWLSAGLELELAITERASVSLGGQYLKMVGDQGDLNSVDWYGSGSTSGIELHGGFVVPLPSNLFVHGELNYRRITTNFNGDGTLTQLWGVTDATDTAVGAAVDVGIQF